MLYKFSILFILFIIYSFIGFIIEVTAESLEQKRFSLSRGFLIGPIIPIFGLGAIAIVTFLDKYSDDILTCFILATVICSVLEYTTSFLMEKIFKMRWWDYSHKKYNINGRVALDFAMYFGIGGVIMLKYVHPLIKNFLLSINPNTLINISTILMVLFLTDVIVSTNIILEFKENVTKLVKRDSTLKIKAEVRRVLKERSVLTIRLVKAFPNLDIFNRKGKIRKIQKLILNKKEYKEIQKERNERK